MKKKVALPVIALLIVFVVAGVLWLRGRTQLPGWAPANPSAEFVRAAKVLKALPSGEHTPLDVPVWECFGALTDQQLNDLMRIRQMKLKADSTPQQVIDYLKRNCGATESDGYIVYNTRGISIPVKALNAMQHKALEEIMKDKRVQPQLQQIGAAPDLSNVDFEFSIRGDEVWFSFSCTRLQSCNTFSQGPYGNVRK